MRNRLVLQVALLTLAGGLVIAMLAFNVRLIAVNASEQADPIDALFTALIVVSGFIFSLVTSVLLVAVFNFRRRHGERRDGPPIQGHSGLEAFWTAIPAVIVTGVVVFSAVVLSNIERKKPNTQIVHVNAQQFAWLFDYPDLQVKSATELHLVKGRNYLFKINTKDVIHSFWVPEFRIKKDAVPGITTEARITPTRNGTFTLVCAELCGLGHATMRARVVVEDQGTFDRWAAGQQRESG